MCACCTQFCPHLRIDFCQEVPDSDWRDMVKLENVANGKCRIVKEPSHAIYNAIRSVSNLFRSSFTLFVAATAAFVHTCTLLCMYIHRCRSTRVCM